MDHDISGLHHVGHLVHDMDQALELYRRLGFALPGPAYPVLGEPPQPFGVGNTHAYFPGNFIELVTVAGSGRVPADARLIPLRASEEALPRLKEAIRGTAANLASCLRRDAHPDVRLAGHRARRRPAGGERGRARRGAGGPTTGGDG